jgi:hypothetical protein
MLKKVLHRIRLFLKHVLAFFVDLIFPILDLVEAVLLALPLPQTKKLVELLEKLELQLIHGVNVLKEVKEVVVHVEEKLGK